MKQFLKFVLATVTGLFLFLIIFFILGAIMISSADKEVEVLPNSVLKLDLTTPVKERGMDDPFAALSPAGMGSDAAIGLNDILASIERAETDDNIKGIYLNAQGAAAGWGAMEEIRMALEDFQASGKFVIAYGEWITQKAYYLASVADGIYLNPSGMMELKGFGAELSFYKNMLEKLNVEPQIFYVGDYKSATEPFRNTEMSEANREQISSILNDVYQDYLETVSGSRDFSKEELHDIINGLKIRTAKDALSLKAIDGLKYFDEVQDEIRTNLGIDEDKKINWISLSKYKDAPGGEEEYNTNKIAVVYAEGGIVDGPGGPGEIGSGEYLKILQKVKESDKVKAVVLRVNSGGGSALASDIMWRELSEIKAAGKPVVVSMGDVAASGGYFIACMADTILAEANTITGSIGVFGMLFNVDQLYNETLGITFDRVKTTEHSDFPTSPLLTKELNDVEREVIQNSVEQIYDQFLARVAEGRNMTVEEVHEIAQGRVWTGRQALENGLVDKLGTINDAIDIAAGMAGLDEYRQVDYPAVEDPIERIMKQLTGEDEEAQARILRAQLGDQYKYFRQIQDVLQMRGYQARMPFEINIE